MAKTLFQRLQTTRGRTLMLLVGFLVVVTVVIVVFFTKKSNPQVGTESKTAAPPTISSVPGAVTSERYQQLQEAENAKRAQQAAKTGTTAIPTITGTRSGVGSDRETFGIEGDLLGQCKCPPTLAGVGQLDPAMAAQLISEIEKDPSKALALLKANPGLAKAMCTQKPDLALKIAQQSVETARIFLKECPDMAKRLAEANPELFKKVMLADPELARQLAAKNPDLFKKLMLEDPEFARALAKSNPDLVKKLLADDPDFARALAKVAPDVIKDLMKGDPAFARLMAKNVPDVVKKLMLDDPEFARMMAQENPDMVKDLMRNDPDFARALAKANPTLVKELMKNDPEFAKEMNKLAPDMVQELMKNDPEFARAMSSILAKKEEKPAPKPEVIVQQQRPLTQAEILAAQKLADEQNKVLQKLFADMQTEANTIMQSWNQTRTQQYTEGDWREKEAARREKEAAELAKAGVIINADGSKTVVKPIGALIKAGTILFAVLDTAVNSDEPGPVLATIVTGEYKGSKLIGTLKLFSTPESSGVRAEKVSLSFNQMNVPSFPNTIPVDAVAIDPDTARTALATDVDHHYLLRYGSTFASSFLIGYAQVLTQQGTTQQTSTNGLSVTTTTPSLSTSQQIWAALGEVGKTWGQQFQTYINRANTIRVESCTGLGILFLTDVAQPR